MKALVLDCSPRKGGNSDIILDSILDRFDVDYAILRDLKYSPCNACDICSSKKSCVHIDDADRLYEDIEGRDTIIFVAPVYFFSFDAHTKAFIDRAQYMWSKPREKREKKVYLIAVGGQTLPDNFYPMERTMHAFAVTIGAKYEGGLFFAGVDAKGDIRRDDNISKIEDFVSNILD